MRLWICLWLGAVFGGVPLGAQELPEPRVHLILPTENRGLLEGRLAEFYQVTISKRLKSGMYGFVRSNLPEPPPYFERFHEGIDVRPVRLDASGRPLDPVVAVADGVVVYTNLRPKASNYGYYVKVKHAYGPYEAFTTYGHLASVAVKEGQVVKAGERIGILGWSGNVEGPSYAHLHLEFGFMYHPDFAAWFRKHAEPSDGTNEHGTYNGINFIGIDPSRLIVESAAGRAPAFEDLFRREKTTFRIRVPGAGGPLNFQRRFPFLTEAGLEGPEPVSWEIDCNRVGMPLAFRRSETPCAAPEVVWFDESLSLQDSFTRGLVEKKDGRRQLSRHGRKWASLLVWKRS